MNVFEVRNNILLAKLKDHRYGHQTFHISQTLENRNWYESFDLRYDEISPSSTNALQWIDSSHSIMYRF